ncbi:Phox-like protein [Basidiobolus meristosporus CBS 931.73]|uniref:Phox-like protein n=1 Tax=Basidiobolus meristosporus CBS 931.73 TaxID=1314790 RepID=A0A1Y1YPQ9_9FUNG|nr:Phox-like protein [Basidiobolus meristosporus CBS 931.73]|eukprot:ORX99991.1 Phox-like protein [Basidiobolus meristosporus CBS 931.73]
MVDNIKTIRITDIEERKTPTAHVAYKISVQASVRSWSVYRRYSEFFQLHSALLRAVPKYQPPYPLPPKSYSLFASCKGIEFIEERREGLEKYLKGILNAPDSRWRDTSEWGAFLEIPKIKTTDLAKSFTSESWLDEANAIQTLIRENRAFLLRRDVHYSQQEIAAAHNCTLQAKKGIALLNQRLSTLENGLAYLAGTTSETAVISEGERSRRRDKLNKLFDEVSMLSKLIASGVRESPTTAPAAFISERDNLLHPRAAAKQTEGAPTSSRVFGNTRALPKETEKTTGLDNKGLLNLQQQIMHEQDSSLQQFSAILKRQLHIGVAVGQELDAHNQLLGELDQDLDRTQSKLKTSAKRLEKIK